jgi:iron(III) transport system ATP-binding protein
MIRIRNLRMTYKSAAATHVAVRGVSLDIPDGHFYTLLGPSGCGKTTTLRCVAGLETPDEGEIMVGGEVVFSSKHNICLAPNHRRIGMVFQSYAIWPHMTVFDNVAFPLRHQNPRPNKADIREKVLKALALVQLDGLEDRPAPFLSGGQQQRLALARALVGEPRVLLLDEPLSNLDAKLREEMRIELRELIERLRVTTLFVTHEQIEALTLSDIIAVMSDGNIVQQGSPTQIYGAPEGMFVADFVGKTNFLKATVLSLGGGGVSGGGAASVMPRVETSIGSFACHLQPNARQGENVTIAVRPENVEMTRAATQAPGDNAVRGEVSSVVFLGNMLDCTVNVGAQKIRVHVHPSQAPARGEAVTLRLPVEHCLVMAG